LIYGLHKNLVDALLKMSTISLIINVAITCLDIAA
jgi:hypothetical protein